MRAIKYLNVEQLILISMFIKVLIVLIKFLKKKIDYVMSCVTGIDGLEPTLKIIRFTKKIAIANKESIICGWNLIQNELKKQNIIYTCRLRTFLNMAPITKFK